MKRFFAGILSVLLVAFLASSFTNTKKDVVRDVGYSLTIDQNLPIVTIPEVQNPVIAGEVNYLLERGVSVPYKGLNFETLYFINENQISRFMCRIDNYSQLWQKSINTNYKLVSDKGVNQYSQGVFRLDIEETFLT